MKKINYIDTVFSVCFMLVLIYLNTGCARPQTFCTSTGNEQIKGEKDGYIYELWNQYGQGVGCITIGSGTLFSGEWNGIENYLARRGLGYDQTKRHQEIGSFYADYQCNFMPTTTSGNSYLSIYGWTVDPLVEYYIVEDWRNWIPSMAPNASLKGSFEVNGSIYDIYEHTRVNQPSIVGNTTFQQYFSIRRDTRNNGTINISDHFNKWDSLGMPMGNLHEVSFVVEGYQNSGSFEFKELVMYVK